MFHLIRSGGLCKKMPPLPEACSPFGNRVQITVFCISTFNRHLLTAILEYDPSFGKHVHASRKLCTLFPKGVLASGTGHIFLHKPQERFCATLHWAAKSKAFSLGLSPPPPPPTHHLCFSILSGTKGVYAQCMM